MRPRSKHPFLWTAALLLLFIAGLTVGRRPILEGLGEFLIVSDSLEKADAILVLRGHETNRCPTGAELYRAGWAPRILITRESVPYDVAELRRFGVRQLEGHEKAVEILKYLGIPDEALVFVDGFNESTFDEGRRLRDYMLEKGLRSVIVVTSNSHTRRTRLLLRRLFSPAGLKVIVRAAPPSWQFDSHEWWTRRFHAKVLFEEYQKLVYYSLRYW